MGFSLFGMDLAMITTVNGVTMKTRLQVSRSLAGEELFQHDSDAKRRTNHPRVFEDEKKYVP